MKKIIKGMASKAGGVAFGIFFAGVIFGLGLIEKVEDEAFKRATQEADERGQEQ